MLASFFINLSELYMPIFTPLGTDALVNTNIIDSQISPQVVALADGRYMVVWVGSVVLPLIQSSGTFAPSYADADIRAQIYNADGSRSGGEIVINTATAGAQLRPIVVQLTDGNVLVTWQNGVGPAGGSAETSMNMIRAQEFTSIGVATGSEFKIGASNGRLHSVAPTPTGGFVAVFQQGGVGGAFPAGNLVGQVYNSSNVQINSFVVDNTQPLATAAPRVVVEADGDVVVYWRDSTLNFNGLPSSAYRSSRFDVNSNFIGNGPTFQDTDTIVGAITLATGGHAIIGSMNPGNNNPATIFAAIYSVDGSLSEFFEVVRLPSSFAGATIAPLANGGFIASWIIDSDPAGGGNFEIMAQAFNAIGNPVGEAFQVNTIVSDNQFSPVFAQLTDGDIIAVWSDISQLNGDTSGVGINMRRIDFNPVNQVPVATDITITSGGDGSIPVDINPYDFRGFLEQNGYPDGYDADGDPLIISAISNAVNGTATINPDGTVRIAAAVGATGPVSFDYTISDGVGGTATARATITFPNDYVTVRPGSTVLIDYLANDFYVPQPGATAFTLSPEIINGTFSQGSAFLISTPQGSRVVFNPLGPARGTIYEFIGVQLNSVFFDLVVGQNQSPFPFGYFNDQTSAGIFITVQGWAQLGGAADDSFTGTSLSDHLSGGAGTNILTGLGGDDWYTVTNATTTIVEAANAGIDSVRTSLSRYTLPSNVENLFVLPLAGSFVANWRGNGRDNHMSLANGDAGGSLFGLGGNDRLDGSRFDDVLDGGNGNDVINAFVGGVDTVNAGAGDDSISFGSSLTALDSVDGGAGNDQVGIVGNYTGSNALILGAATLTNVEVLAALSGGSYDIRLNDATTAAGATFTVFGGNLAVGENFTVNAAAETNGTIITYGGLGTDTITGGAGNDGFYFGPSKYGVGDTVTGGSGTNDQLALDGDYTITVTSREDVEVLALLRGPVSAPNSFNITVADSFTPTGQTRTIWGGQLLTSLTIDGSAETGGNFTFFGGSQSDTLTGGAGADSISGGGSGDVLRGGLGNDSFRYNDVAHSNGSSNATRDQILDFTAGDRIDLSGIDAITGGSDDAFTFIGNGAFTNVAGQLRYTDNGNGTYTVEGDVNGDGIADLAILVTSPSVLIQGDFVI
jgi:Ca2+-binding RTX toxin-like protein